MAKQTSGEVSLTLKGKRSKLRLSVGTLMELEDYFDKSFMELARDLSRGRMGITARFYLAMTGQDFTDETKVKEAAGLLNGPEFVPAVKAIAECMKNSLSLQPASEDEASAGE